MCFGTNSFIRVKEISVTVFFCLFYAVPEQVINAYMRFALFELVKNKIIVGVITLVNS